MVVVVIDSGLAHSESNFEGSSLYFSPSKLEQTDLTKNWSKLWQNLSQIWQVFGRSIERSCQIWQDFYRI